MEFHAGLQYLDSIFGVPKKLSIIFRGQQRNSGMDPPVLKVREYPPWGRFTSLKSYTASSFKQMRKIFIPMAINVQWIALTHEQLHFLY